MIEAARMGDIEIATDAGSITLTDMWHGPNIGGNLMSVSRMVDTGYSVEFGPTMCTVNQGATRSHIGQRVANLYYLNNNLYRTQIPLLKLQG